MTLIAPAAIGIELTCETVQVAVPSALRSDLRKRLKYA